MRFPSRLVGLLIVTVAACAGGSVLARTYPSKTIRARLDELGMTAYALSRGQARRFVQQEIERWVGYVKAACIEPQ
jgi:hypothetical protein